MKKNLTELKPEILSKVAKQILHKEIKMSQNDIDSIADVNMRIASIKSEGGPSPIECFKMIKKVKLILKQAKTNHKNNISKINKALDLLSKEIHKL